VKKSNRQQNTIIIIKTPSSHHTIATSIATTITTIIAFITLPTLGEHQVKSLKT